MTPRMVLCKISLAVLYFVYEVQYIIVEVIWLQKERERFAR